MPTNRPARAFTDFLQPPEPAGGKAGNGGRIHPASFSGPSDVLPREGTVHPDDRQGMMGTSAAQRAMTPDELKQWAQGKLSEIAAQGEAPTALRGYDRDANGQVLPGWLSDSVGGGKSDPLPVVSGMPDKDANGQPLPSWLSRKDDDS